MLTFEQMSRLYPYTSGARQIPSDIIVDTAGEWYKQSLYKQLINNEVDNDIRLRPSLLGKAAIDVLARKFYPNLYDDGVTHQRFWQLLHDGDVFECDFLVWLKIKGIPVLDTQVAVDWHGVKGHADMVVEIDGRRVLLELKTSNEGYYSSIMKMQKESDRVFHYDDEAAKCNWLAVRFTDFRGHLTQASVYASALDCDEAVVVVKDKNTSDVILYNIPHTVRKERLVRAANIVTAWDYCDTWEDVYMNVGIPEPKKELREKNHTGRYLVSPKLYGSPIIPLVYEWSLDKDRVIISGYRIPSTITDTLPDKLLKQYDSIDIYEYDATDIPTLLEEWNEYQRLRS